MRTRAQIQAHRWIRTRTQVLTSRAMVIQKPPEGKRYRVTVEEQPISPVGEGQE